MWLMTSTRCGISAKQLEPELGVTYKSAWRMFNLIRNELMSQDDKPLSGEGEADETFVDGKIRDLERRERDALGWDRKKRAAARKTVVYGAVERKGRVKATVIPNKSSRVPVRDAAVEAAGSAAPG
jgi:transposase